MSKRILTAVLLGLAVASHGVLAQDTGTAGRDQSIQQQDEQKYWNDLTPNYHNDDSPNYPFTA
jgi:hypothetical protein